MPQTELSTTTVYDLAHAGWGALIAVSFALFGHPWIGIAVSTSAGVVKAYAWDYKLEGSSLPVVWTATWPWLVGVSGAALLSLAK